MQLKFAIPAICIFLQSAICFAQKNKKTPGLFFQSITGFGTVSGESETAPQFQITNGLKYKTYFAGISVGLDIYYRTSLPLSIDLRKNIFARPRTPFVYLKAGINFPLQKEKESSLLISQQNGLYYDIGAGYNLCLNKSNALQFSAGYSFKAFSEKKYNPGVMILSVWPPPPNYIEEYQYRLKRISVKVGWSFSLKI